MPDVITNYENFKNIIQSEQALFWIIEYNPQLNDKTLERYSLLRNEILKNPQNYASRLNTGVYRIWTTTPYEKPW